MIKVLMDSGVNTVAQLGAWTGLAKSTVCNIRTHLLAGMPVEKKQVSGSLQHLCGLGTGIMCREADDALAEGHPISAGNRCE